MNIPLPRQNQLASLMNEEKLDGCLLCPSSVTMHTLAEAFGNAVDAKDRHTARHSSEVAAVAELLARSMSLSWVMVERVDLAAHLHDIGKLGIPDRILRKPGPLHPWEWEIMRTHPRIGADILMPCFPQSSFGILRMVECHHERHAGGGYPQGLARRDISLGARILAVADSYAAMRQHRPYRRGKTHQEAMNEIARGTGTLYDPDVAREFILAHDAAEEMWAALARRRGPLPWQPVSAVDSDAP